MDRDERFMARALELAGKALGETFPNPLVGAVVVSDGEIVGEGWHHAAGRPHAEIEALRCAGERARGATLYLNLEPCCHYGKTPPCTDALFAAGVSRVVFALYDPDQRVRGRGAAALRSRGIDIRAGVLAPDALELNLHYVHRSLTGRPLVTVKLASTLDGGLTTDLGPRITGEKAHRAVHGIRAWNESIAVGIGTILTDRPVLDRRLFREGMEPPVRIVLDSNLAFPPDYPWLERRERVIVFCRNGADAAKRRALEERGAEVASIPEGSGGLDLGAWIVDLGLRGMTSVLVEGGARAATSIIRDGLFDRLVLFHAPLIGGKGSAPWYGEERRPPWLAPGALALKRCEELEDDVMAVYDAARLGAYIDLVTKEGALVHGAH